MRLYLDVLYVADRLSLKLKAIQSTWCSLHPESEVQSFIDTSNSVQLLYILLLRRTPLGHDWMAC